MYSYAITTRGKRDGEASAEHVTEQLGRHGEVHHNLRDRLVLLRDLGDELARIEIVGRHVLLQLSMTYIA